MAVTSICKGSMTSNPALVRASPGVALALHYRPPLNQARHLTWYASMSARNSANATAWAMACWRAKEHHLASMTPRTMGLP